MPVFPSPSDEPLVPLATVADFTARAGLTPTPTEEVRIELALKDASATVRTFTGQQFTAGSSVVRLRHHRGRLVLPQRPVTSIVLVQTVAGTTVTYEWDGLDYLIVSALLSPLPFDIEPFRTDQPLFVVEYTHGYATVPDVVVKVVCQLAARAFAQPAGQGGLQSESIDGYSYSVGAITAAGALFDNEKAELAPFTRPVGVTHMLQ